MEKLTPKDIKLVFDVAHQLVTQIIKLFETDEDAADIRLRDLLGDELMAEFELRAALDRARLIPSSDDIINDD